MACLGRFPSSSAIRHEHLLAFEAELVDRDDVSGGFEGWATAFGLAPEALPFSVSSASRPVEYPLDRLDEAVSGFGSWPRIYHRPMAPLAEACARRSGTLPMRSGVVIQGSADAARAFSRCKEAAGRAG
jgi:hypothetical protein